jgi:uncharacterized protein YcbX
MPAVTGLAVTAVKGTRLRQVDCVELGRDGVRENRRFYLIDDENLLVNSKRVGKLQQVIADYSEAERRLRLELPDGQVVDDEVRLGDQVVTKFFSRAAPGTARGRRRSAISSGGVCGWSRPATPRSTGARRARCR